MVTLFLVLRTPILSLLDFSKLNNFKMAISLQCLRQILTISSTISFVLSSGVTIITTESIGFVGSGSGRMTVMVVGVVLVSKSTGNKGSVANNYVKLYKKSHGQSS